MIELTNDNFRTEILEDPSIVLVDFWAPWCGPCKSIAPLLDELANDLPDVRFAKLNVDDNHDIMLEYAVRSIPTLMLFKNGKPIATKIGAGMPKAQLSKWIESFQNN